MNWRFLVSLWIVVLLAGCGGDGSSSTGTGGAIPLDLAEEGIVLTIETPVDGSWFSASPVLVTGTATGLDSDWVSVNGMKTPVLQGFYSMWVPLEGAQENVIVVSLPDGTKEESVTVHLDDLPPSLTVASPERGAVYENGGAVDVEVTALDEESVATLTVGGVERPGVTSGVFSVPLNPGIQHVTVEATDLHGNFAREHRSVLAGPMIDCEELAQSPTVVVGIGQDLLTITGVEVGKAIEAADPNAFLDPEEPAFSSESTKVWVDNLIFEGVTVSLEAGEDSLSLSLQVASIQAEGRILIGESTFTMELGLEDVLLGATLEVTVPVPGELSVAPKEVQMEADDIQIAVFDSNGEEFVAPTGVSGPFLDFLTDILAQFALDSLDSTLQESAQYGSGTVNLDWLGQSFAVTYKAQSARIESRGLRIEMAADVAIDGVTVHPWSHGCPGGSLTPIPPTVESPGLQLWVAYPLLNHLLLQAWGVGTIDFDVTQSFVDGMKAEVQLVCGMLGTLRETATPSHGAEEPLTVGISPRLPPLLASGDLGSGEMALSVGDLELELACSGVALAQAFLSLDAALALSVKGNRLYTTLRLPRFYLDMEGLDAEAKRRVESGIEGSFEGLLGELMPVLSGALTDVELPSVMGYSISGGEAGDEPEADWFRLVLKVETDSAVEGTL